MSAIDAAVISCGSCNKKFAWKPELAGKRVKCKCGQVISVPGAAAPKVTNAAPVARPKSPAPKSVAAAPKKAPPPVASDPGDLDSLYALAEDGDRAVAALPVEVMELPPPEAVAAPKPSKKNSAIPLGYRRGPTARDKEKVAALIDPVRDIYAPIVILAVGFILHVGFFIFRYNLGAGAIVPVGIGVILLTILKASLLIGFALVAAGPLGVSFGGIWTAVLKLAAIAVFTDGAIAWVDVGVAKMSGGFGAGGLFGWGIVGWPVALGLYWGFLIYLFSMDPSDSWMVVCLLSVFDRIMRTVLMLLLLEMILSWGGVAVPALPGAGPRSSSSAHASALTTEVDGLKESDSLVEAKKYIEDGHQAILKQPVADWYAAGCPNVWFSMSGRDINSKRSATGVIVELPTNKDKRAKCYEILKGYYKEAQIDFDPADLKDDGEKYLEVEMK